MLGRLFNNSCVLIHVRPHNNNIILHPFKYSRNYQSCSKLKQSYTLSKNYFDDNISIIKSNVDSIFPFTSNSSSLNISPLHFRSFYEYNISLYPIFRRPFFNIKHSTQSRSISLIPLSTFAAAICAFLLIRHIINSGWYVVDKKHMDH